MKDELIKQRIVKHEDTIETLRKYSQLHPNLFKLTIARHERDIAKLKGELTNG